MVRRAFDKIAFVSILFHFYENVQETGPQKIFWLVVFVLANVL